MKLYIPASLICLSTLVASAAVGPTPSSLCIPQKNATALQQFYTKSTDYERQLQDLEAQVSEEEGGSNEKKKAQWFLSQTHDLLSLSKDISAKFGEGSSLP
ncbi:hypothetical protein NUU61_009598 [Penicillium alfredii]|uniref:Uncharacterized protein n=1 Tax=Penicillium alfredii TaxID=1506179 RepID=A0A9W9EGH6_9EURO|nr:uncharacterized protein NUU61_009598 [Penicillium alfredii]KAJ5081334.1 hypothetical protein NUU61_009598 [Penicillium alfredii]